MDHQRRCILYGIVLCLSSNAWARDTFSDAKKHYDAGEAYYNSTDYESARKEFMQSYTLEPRVSLLYDVARCWEALGNWEMAVNYFESYLDKNPEAPDRMNIEQHIASLRDRIEAEKPKTAVSVELSKPLPPPPAPKRHKSYKAAWALGTLGIGVALAGVGTGAYSEATYNSLVAGCKNNICDSAQLTQRNSGASAALATDILLPVGLGTAGIGLVVFLVERSKK